MGHYAHGYEDHQKVQPDRKIGHKAVILESADLGHEEPGENEQQRTDDVAKAEFGDLAYILAVLDCHLAEEEEEAQCLHDVGHVAGSRAPGTKGKIAVVAAGEFVAVKAKENMPDQIAGVASHEAEDCI